MKLEPWPESVYTPVSKSDHMPTAAKVPDTNPAQPAVAVIRLQNMPRIKVANSGALKNANSVWR
ncbi:Uncharacterised protein [Mycobacteroides abscessus]|nr:Uncharacterised protein [Mycobacteroides abscessus]